LHIAILYLQEKPFDNLLDKAISSITLTQKPSRFLLMREAAGGTISNNFRPDSSHKHPGLDSSSLFHGKAMKRKLF
jgi:hypothetical protein